MSLRELIRILLPPVFPLLARKLGVLQGEFRGSYEKWADAQAAAAGYSTPQVLERAVAARRKVRSGEAVFERDTVVFDRQEYNFELLSALLYVSIQSKGQLRVLDFGGALGSTYFQHQPVLDACARVEWSVVELPDFVAAGKQEAEGGALKFYSTVDEFQSSRKADVLLLSSVLQYLDDPSAFLRSVDENLFPFILIDRTPCWADNRATRIMIQRVSPEIFDARFPVRIFNKASLLEALGARYEVVIDYAQSFRVTLPGMEHRGVLLRRRLGS